MAGAALFCALRLKVTTDITHFLPAGSDHRLATLSRRLADSTLTRTLIVSIGGPTPEAVHGAAVAFADGLRGNQEVAWIQRGPTDKLPEAVYDLYAPRTAYFLSDDPEKEIPSALSDEGLARSARALKRQLSLPLSPLLARLAGADPLQWFPAILRRFERAQAGTLEIDGDQFITPDSADPYTPGVRRWAIVFVGTHHSPFDSRAQAPLLAAIDARFRAINQQAGGVLTRELGGVAPIALDAERHISADLTRISILSMVGVLLLFWLFFGSLRAVLLALLPIAAGALGATTIGLALFGQLHGMTLAIGSTLIGVALDYPILLLTHRVLNPDTPPEVVLRKIWTGILLGGATTAVGFASLAWTSFPGVREMAVTSSVGIVAALLATRYVLPPLLRGRPTRARLLWRGSAALGQALRWLQGRRAAGIGIAAALTLVCVFGLPRLRWLDSLRALDPGSPRLKAELDRVRLRVSAMDEGRFVVATAPDMEQALRLNDQVFQVLARLEKERGDGALDGLTSLHAFLWSAELQNRNRGAAAAVPDLGARTIAALRQEGFRADAFAAFADGARALAAPPALPPLTLADLESSPLAPLVRTFVVKLGGDIGILTFLRGVRRADQVTAAIADLPGAGYFDQAAFLDETYAHFRIQTLQAVAVGVALILAVLYGRYRRWRLAIAALAPAVIAAAATMGLLGLGGVPTNLLHVLSLLLVLSMGVDYGVFLVESANADVSSEATLMSLLACCLTTVLSFGLLALSGTPALRAIGLVTGIGVSLSLALAPLSLVLTGAAQSAGKTG